MLGTAFTFIASKKHYIGTDYHEYTPDVPTLCPAWKCETQGISWPLFVIEFLTSLVFIFSYLVIRNTHMQDNEMKWMTFVGPTLLFFILTGCLSIVGTSSGGPLNPTVAFELFVWSMGAYNYKDNNLKYPDQTRFTYNHYGRYIWVYACAPLVAAVFAGLLARKHIEVEVPDPDNENKRVFQEN